MHAHYYHAAMHAFAKGHAFLTQYANRIHQTAIPPATAFLHTPTPVY